MVRPRTLLAVPVLIALMGCSRAPERPVSTPSIGSQAAPTKPVATGDAVEGKRLATILGCYNGCHGPEAGGKVFIEKPGAVRLVAPNLTQRRALYDDAALVALLREGRTHDGHRPIGMPILMFQHLSDEDIRHVTAWLRTTPAVENAGLPPSWLSDKVSASLADGSNPNAGDDRPDPGIRPPATRPTDPQTLGRYIAMTSCPECHGRSLSSRPGDDTPPLVVAKAYSADNFVRLMKTGITASGKESRSGLMSMVARKRFSLLTDKEIAALKLYLDSR